MNLNNKRMQYTLTMPNGREIDFSTIILAQMSGKLTRAQVQERIDFLIDLHS
ncbi:MAG: hypothetical protein ACKVJK_12845 [Methylophagaceae bacterium]|jgi:hypothetical protein